MRLARLRHAARRRPAVRAAGHRRLGPRAVLGEADPAVSSLQITAYVTGTAYRTGDPAVAAHPWLARATDYCLRAIADLGEEPFAIAVVAAVLFLDEVHGTRPRPP